MYMYTNIHIYIYIYTHIYRSSHLYCRNQGQKHNVVWFCVAVFPNVTGEKTGIPCSESAPTAGRSPYTWKVWVLGDLRERSSASKADVPEFKEQQSGQHLQAVKPVPDKAPKALWRSLQRCVSTCFRELFSGSGSGRQSQIQASIWGHQNRWRWTLRLEIHFGSPGY